MGLLPPQTLRPSRHDLWPEDLLINHSVQMSRCPCRQHVMSANGMARPRPAPTLLDGGWGGVTQSSRSMRCAQHSLETVSTIGIDVGKNTFHLVGFDKRGAIVLQQKVTRHQLGRRLSNIPRCLIGMETCSGTHFIARRLTALGHDVRLIPAQYVKPFLKGHKNDYRDVEAI